jgi:nitrogen fixation NifU-like protein
MSELNDLYQQVILDHNRRPRNFRKLEGANRQAEGVNPLCGDQITVYAQVDGNIITDLAFQGSGCAISKASASIMTDSLKGKTTAEAEQLFQDVHSMLTGSGSEPVDPEELGKVAVLSGVCAFPTRVKCATLSWHALRAALKGDTQPVSTE